MSGPDTGVVVLVDGENVRRSQWPNVATAQLVELCRAWAAANGGSATVVFDGDGPDGVVGEKVLETGCTVVGSAAESADAWLERRAAALAAEGRRFWLVTSDRALRASAGARAEQTLGGGSFLRTLLDTHRESDD